MLHCPSGHQSLYLLVAHPQNGIVLKQVIVATPSHARMRTIPHQIVCYITNESDRQVEEQTALTDHRNQERRKY